MDELVDQAGDNKGQLLDALNQASETEKSSLKFLIQNMSKADLKSLTAEFLLENIRYAHQAREESAWKVPDEIFLNDVLPFSNIDEKRERWRPEMHKRARKIIEGCKTPAEAAQCLNQKLFAEVGVKYSTKRKKANQAPGESIEQGLASCTGLSILLVDACRSVNVPARLVGIPKWANKRGNHTWVEVWDDGQWHFTGAAEYSKEGLNRTWFQGDAALAIKQSKLNAIYAVSFKKTDTPFPMVWSPGAKPISAINVTDRYTAVGRLLAEDELRVMVRARSRVGEKERVATKVEIAGVGSKTSKFNGTTRDESADTNDFLTFVLKRNQKYKLMHTADDENVAIDPIEFVTPDENQMMLDFQVPEDAPGDTVKGNVSLDGHRLKGAVVEFKSADGKLVSKKAVDGKFEMKLDPPDATRGIQSATIKLAQDEQKQQEKDAEDKPLSKEEAAKEIDRQFAAHVHKVQQSRRDEWESKLIKLDDLEMKFDYRKFGDKPKNGHALYISMHGGGGAPKRVNDQQWKNQIGLYEPKEGIYLAPRAPTDTWNLWHQSHIDTFFTRIIENAIAFEGIDPNRVYLMGYSAGGDGVYQLAPRMADQFAAAAMMAGHPNGVSPLGLRNIGFTIHMGGKDSAYKRNEVAAQWKTTLADLQKADPKGYKHEVVIHPKHGHWMQRDDAVAVPWMSKFTRDPIPSKVVWHQSNVTHDRFYWLAAEKEDQKGGAKIVVSREGNTFTIEEAEKMNHVTIRLNDAMVDFSKPIIVMQKTQDGSDANKQTFSDVHRSAKVIAATLAERGDNNLAYTAEIKVKISN